MARPGRSRSTHRKRNYKKVCSYFPFVTDVQFCASTRVLTSRCAVFFLFCYFNMCFITIYNRQKGLIVFDCRQKTAFWYFPLCRKDIKIKNNFNLPGSEFLIWSVNMWIVDCYFAHIKDKGFALGIWIFFLNPVLDCQKWRMVKPKLAEAAIKFCVPWRVWIPWRFSLLIHTYFKQRNVNRHWVQCLAFPRCTKWWSEKSFHDIWLVVSVDSKLKARGFKF